MKSLLILCGQDVGGQAIRLKRAFDRYSVTWRARTMREADNVYRYPADLEWDWSLARELYQAADVVLCQTSPRLWALLDQGERKPLIVHHQGTRLRDNPEAVAAESRQIGAVDIVSTVDLLEAIPTATWLPSPYDLAMLATYDSGARRNLSVAHAPTNRDVKGTEIVIDAVAELNRRRAHKLPVELDIIEGRDWRVSMSRKGRGTVVVDQLYLGIGNNALEAWGAGRPVISGVTDVSYRNRMFATWGFLPFVESAPTVTELALRIEELVDDRYAARRAAERGWEYLRAYHDEERVVRLLERILRDVPPTTGDYVPAETRRKVAA